MNPPCHFWLRGLFLALLSVVSAFAKSQAASHGVFVVSAANMWMNWTEIESFCSPDTPWSVHVANLDGFGRTMNEQGSFQAALEQFDERLRRAIKLIQPDVVLVASKGLNILTHLANENVYNGPAVLLSPIPNQCDHIEGTTWVEQWNSSLNVLVKNKVGPIGIGVGSSLDEKSLIVDTIDETQVCGRLLRSQRSHVAASTNMHFEMCPDWFIRTFPGDHGWKNVPSNSINVASIINSVLAMKKQRPESVDNEL